MRSSNDIGASSHDPIRWADMPAETLGPAGKLLVSPAPIKALPSDVAMRVRSNVLRGPAPSMVPTQSGSVLTRNAAALKLGGIAVGAALFGAGAMTVLSSAQDSSGLRVVVGPSSHVASADDADARPRTLQRATTEGASFSKPTSLRIASPDSANGATDGLVPPTARQAASLGAGNELREVTATSDHGKELDGRGGEAPLTPGGSPAEQHVVSAAAERATRVSPSDERNVAESESSTHGTAKDGDFELLTQAEAIDRPVVRPQFRRVTAARKAAPRTELSSLEEETRLLEEARSKLGRTPDAALSLALEHQSRFRQGQLLEQRRMIHLEALLRLGRDDEAKKLASTIGSSIYQARANALLVRYGIVVE